MQLILCALGALRRFSLDNNTSGKVAELSVA